MADNEHHVEDIEPQEPQKSQLDEEPGIVSDSTFKHEQLTEDDNEIISRTGLQDRLSRSSLQHIASESLNAQDLLRSVGGVRGIIETIIPSFAFIIAFLVTDGDLIFSVVVPVVLSVLLIAIRLLSRIDPMPAVSGFVGLSISALLAYFTGDIMQHFLMGLITNTVLGLVIVVSIVVRKPFIGLVVALLKEIKWELFEPLQQRMMYIASWAWVGLFLVRLSIQIPLYFSQAAAELAFIRILTGVPLLIGVLWVTWFCVRIAFPAQRAD